MPKEDMDTNKPSLEKIIKIQAALTSIEYEIKGFQIKKHGDILLRLSEIQSFVRIDPTTGVVDNFN